MPISNDKYIFISYSHKDSTIVVPLIEGLKNRGFNVWYDSGIEAGTEWPAYIEEMLLGCEAFVAFISENAGESFHCRSEITHAIKYNKKILVVYLEELKNSHGLGLLLTTLQSIYKKRFAEDEAFINELSAARILSDCKKESIAESTEVKSEALRIPVEQVAEEKPEIVTESEDKEKKVTVGIIEYSDESFYKGELIDGKPNGNGKYVSDEFTKVGFFVDGELNGKGKITFKSGILVEGDFVDGELHGNGKRVSGMFTDEGLFVKGKLNGKGKRSWGTGDIDEGDFVDGTLNGKGKKIHSYGDVEEGDFVNGRLHGKGKSTDRDGNIYEGDFADGKPDGRGKLTMIWGISVEGEFIGNELVASGIVKITFADSFVYQGAYINGIIRGTKNGTDFYMDTNCRIAIGKFLRGKLNGKGETFSTYMKTEGDFTDGFLNGKGKKLRADGSSEEGSFVRGELYKGMKIYSKSGRIYKGKWENGDLINGYICDKNGKKIKKVVDGEKKDIGPLGF